MDPNFKVGPSGYGSRQVVSTGELWPYSIYFENDPSATVPAQQVVISDQLANALDWTTLGLTEISFGDHFVTVPPHTQHFETTVKLNQDGVDFEVQIEAGIHLDTGEVYARFQSVDPTTGLPPPVEIGFLPPEDDTGRGRGQISYVVRPKSDLPAGTEVRNVAYISFDQQPAIATDQIDPHDPSKGTDPNKQALVTVAPTTATLTVSSSEHGSVSQPGQGTFTYDWGSTVDLTATPDPGYQFVNWSGDVDTIVDPASAHTSIGLYDNFSVTANFAPLGEATPTPSITPTPTPTPTPSPSPVPCLGDCNHDGTVTVDELVGGVNMALGSSPVGTCPAFDNNEDGKVTIDELVEAVNAAINGCSN